MTQDTRTIKYRPEELLPHRGRSCLLNAIEGHGDDWIAARVDVSPQSPYFNGAGVPSWVAIEYMAQTGAAFYGMLRRQQGLPPKVALLLGTRRFRCSVTEFLPGPLRINAQIELLEEQGMAAFSCELSSENTRLGGAVLKAYRPENLLQFIGQPTTTER